MTREIFSDDCPGCRPSLINLQTGKQMADDDPIMQTVNAVWKQTSYAERQAFHRVCCQNSRRTTDLLACESISQKMQAAMKKEGS
jgi:hypothetical protein